VEEVHALPGLTDQQCDDMIEYSPDPDVRLIRNVYGLGRVYSRGCGEERGEGGANRGRIIR
jgi:hypothetical protein